MFPHGTMLNLWYRYPSEPVPRTAKVRYTGPWSVADAVALCISKDAGLTGIVKGDRPTERLLETLRGRDDPQALELLTALTYASIQPPPYQPYPFTHAAKRRKDEADEGAPLLKRRRAPATNTDPGDGWNDSPEN